MGLENSFSTGQQSDLELFFRWADDLAKDDLESTKFLIDSTIEINDLINLDIPE